LGLEHGSSSWLFESTGWLAAHRRKHFSAKQNSAHFHHDSLTGQVTPATAQPFPLQGWRSCSLTLLGRPPVVNDDTQAL
jgi:hypothetical protein